MSQARRLQNEISRTLKNIQDHLIEFDRVYELLTSSETRSQEERFQADLKTQIKRLQKLREQVKRWQTQSDVRDKDSLAVARRSIEERMELFKEIERRSKTKTFSKEGLAQAPRLSQADQEKEDCFDYLTTSKETIDENLRLLQNELHDLLSSVQKSSKKSRKRKRPPPVASLSEEQELQKLALESYIEQHLMHQEKLEQLLRLLQTDTITSEEIMDEIQDSLDYYIEHYRDDDFFDDPDLYEGLNLEQFASVADVGRLTKAEDSPVPTPTKDKLLRTKPRSSSTASDIITLPPPPPPSAVTSQSDDTAQKAQSRPPPAPRRASSSLSSPRPSSRSEQVRTPIQLPPPPPADSKGDPQRRSRSGSSASSSHSKRDRSDSQPSDAGQTVTLAPKPSVETPLAAKVAQFEATLTRAPQLEDEMLFLHYLPSNPRPVPEYFPKTVQVDLLTNHRTIARYDDLLLMYLFFFEEQRHTKFRAFRELAKRRWVFDCNHHMWLKLDGDPSESNSKYIRGKFTCLDLSRGEFKFKTLEDHTFYVSHRLHT